MESQARFTTPAARKYSHRDLNRTQCLFPRITFPQSHRSRWTTACSAQAFDVLEDLEIHLATIAKAAWALTLGRYINTRSVAFYTAETVGGDDLFGLTDASWNESTSLSEMFSTVRKHSISGSLEAFLASPSATAATFSLTSVNTALVLRNASPAADHGRDRLLEFLNVSRSCV